MRFFIRTFFLMLSVGFCCIPNEMTARHIVGGDVTYTFVQFNADTTLVTFFIDVTMYRDSESGGASFDQDASFGVFRQTGPGSWTLVNQIDNIDPSVPFAILPNDDPCVEEPINQIGVEQASYRFNVTLPIIDENYMIAYQRCCRNETISNLINPGDQGAVFDVVITPEAQILGNNSPDFNTFPPIFICAGFPIFVDQSATDADGDELVYSFCTPFTAGGTLDANTGGQGGCCECVRPEPDMGCIPEFDEVPFRAPFTQRQPLGGDPLVQIDPSSGLITGTPVTTGQFVVGVCIEEFRNGVSLGKIRRDFQFNVLACEKQVNAVLDSDNVLNDSQNTFVINSCGDTSITIRNLSTDVDFIQTYDWTFYRGTEIIFELSGGVEARDADVVFPGLGFYEGIMILNEGIDCADTAFFEVNMFPSITAAWDFSFDTCVAGPVAFVDTSFSGAGVDALTNWTWDFDDGRFSSLQNPSHLYDQPGQRNVTLIVEDTNECMDTLSQEFNYQPAPAVIIVEPNSFIGCTPSEITLNNLSSPIDSTYFILWDLGDGSTSGEISPTHTYLEAGDFNLSLDIVSPIGCGISDSFDGLIRIRESPEADFDCFPDDPTALNRTVSFTDLSRDAGAWSWDFGGTGNSFEQSPTYTFPDTGIHNVILTVLHPITNCPDTMSKIIDVRPTVEFHFPNAFTPNADSNNDLFLGNGFHGGLIDFEMSIWNRWGQMVFETQDSRAGWNGQEFNTGKASPQGVYVFKASYKDPRGNDFVQEGHVTLLR